MHQFVGRCNYTLINVYLSAQWGFFFPLNDFKQWLIAPLMIDWSIPTRVYYKFVLPGDIIHRSSMVPRQSANTLPRQILNRRPEKTYTLLSIFLLPHWFMIKLMLTHPVHFQLDTLSRSSQCGHRCTKPASDHLHQNTNSTLWTCVPVRWPGTPSHHPLLCKGKCCCHSWLRPGAVQSHGECRVTWCYNRRWKKKHSCGQIRMRPTSWVGCQTTCLTSCVWEFTTVTHSYSSSSSTAEQEETWSSLETGNGADQYVQFRRSLTQTFPNPDALVSATCG